MNNQGNYGPHIVQAPKEYSLCTGCVSCEMICTMLHDGYVSPGSKRIFFEHGDVLQMMHTIHSCRHCTDHPCYDACPKKGEAMCIDENGIVYVNEEACIGCGLCRKNCRFDPPRISITKGKTREERKAKKCDLCRTRPEGPACVQYCPSRVLEIKEDGKKLPWEQEEWPV